MVRLLVAATAVALITGSASAAPCRDAKGHFAKCPPPGSGVSGAVASKGSAASSLPTGVTKDAKGRCHAAGGKFVACPT